MFTVVDWKSLFDIKDKIATGRHYVDQKYPEHSHEFFEIGYVASGKCYHIIDDCRVLVKEGDYFIIDYGSVHGYEFYNDEQAEIINCLFVPSLIDLSLKYCKSFIQILNSYLITFNNTFNKKAPVYTFFDDTGEIRHLIEKINNEYSSRHPGSIQIMRAYIIEIIILSMRKYYKDSRIDISNSSVDIEGMLRFISENYDKQITLAELAAKANISLGHLSKLFKKATGFTFTQYLQGIRVEHACRLLANTSKKVIEVSSLVGYTDLKFFLQTFKKFTGLSPTQYRKG